MRQIDVISSDPAQEFIIINENGEKIYIKMLYSILSFGWFLFLEYPYKNFKLFGKRIVSSENLLKNYRNIIDFGLQIKTENNEEPFFLDSFSTEKSKMYLLSSEEI